MTKFLKNNLRITSSRYSTITGISKDELDQLLKKENITPLEGSEYDYHKLVEVVSKNFKRDPVQKKVITISTGKGGVGKTSLGSYNLPFYLSAIGYKTLVVDLDYQCNLSQAMGADIYSNSPSIKELYQVEGVATPVRNLIQKVAFNLDLIMGSIDGKLIEEKLSTKRGREDILNRRFRDDKIIEEYDFIFFDTHSAGGYTADNAFRISDLVLSPINPDAFSKSGLFPVAGTVQDMKEAFADMKTEHRVVLNNFEGNVRAHKNILGEFIDLADGILYSSAIRKSNDFSNSINESTPIILFKHNSNGLKDLASLSQEFLKDCLYNEFTGVNSTQNETELMSAEVSL